MKQALFWKLLERFGVQIFQFVLQIILARLLAPELYGTLSIMIVFTNIANVFVQRGFNTALVQNKDVTDEDFSSVFWVSMGVAAGMYAVLFFAAPLIASFYAMPEIIAPFRVICLILLPGAMNSVQIARLSRGMDFRKVFYGSLGGILVSGVCGIVLAYMGAGLWALVAQSLLNVTVSCIIMLFTVKWKPRLVCRIHRIRILFSYGSKLLAAGLLDVVYQNLHSLVVGKKYPADTLGYYNRGHQFPQFAISAINDSVASVLLPAMSQSQNDKQAVKAITRNSVTLSCYVIFPMMAGLAGVASPLVRLLLTDAWLPCVPYMQIYCFSMAFYPVHTANLQAINAVGRSDIFLKLEFIKKAIGMAALLIALLCFDSPVAIAATGAVTALTSSFVNAYPNKKLIGYSYLEQMRDMLPSFFASVVMCGIVLCVGSLDMSPLLTLVLQVLVGITVYVILSAVFRIKAFSILVDVFKRHGANQKKPS